MDYKFILIKWLPIKREFKMQIERGVIESIHNKTIENAKKIDNDDLVDKLKHEKYFELFMHDESYDSVITKNLLKTARKLFIPTPERPKSYMSDNEFWYFSGTYGEQYLTRKGMFELRKIIREEVEIRRRWMGKINGLIAMLIGLISAISSLATAVGLKIHF